MAETYVSDLKPINARAGANKKGRATMMATREAGTPNSKIITRFNVPVSKTAAMPTES